MLTVEVCGSVERTGTCPFSMPREIYQGLQRQDVQNEALLVQVCMWSAQNCLIISDLLGNP